MRTSHGGITWLYICTCILYCTVLYSSDGGREVAFAFAFVFHVPARDSDTPLGQVPFEGPARAA